MSTDRIDRTRRRASLVAVTWMMGAVAGCASPPPPPPPAPPPPPPPESEAEARNRLRFEDGPDGARAILPNSILFDFGKSDLSPDAGPVLDLLKPAFDKARGKIIVEGHTDGIGTDAANKRLSQERAEKVRQAIVARQVPPNRVDARGLGKEKPRVSPEVSDHDRQQNRRAEILFPGETVDTLGGREIEGKADTVLAQLSKALGQVKEGAKDAAVQVRDGAKSLFDQIKDKFGSKPEGGSKP